VNDEINKTLRRIVREPEAIAASGLGRSVFWDMVNNKLFPQPFKAHDRSRTNLWFLDEVINWQQQRAAVRNQKAPPGPCVKPKPATKV
jgi:predicted DNA-binding transcriptional regulator AlpA